MSRHPAPHEESGLRSAIWAELQAQSGRYSNTSDYVRDLIRKDQDRLRKIEELQALVTAGIASGPGTRSMDELRAVAKKLAMEREDWV